MNMFDGLAALGETGGFKPADVESVAHGTTVALNTVLQHKWAPIGLVVTEGYREIIEIARQTVPGDWGAIYAWIKPPRVVPLENVQEVAERITHHGEVLVELDEDGVRSSARWFKEKDINSVAICSPRFQDFCWRPPRSPLKPRKPPRNQPGRHLRKRHRSSVIFQYFHSPSPALGAMTLAPKAR